MRFYDLDQCKSQNCAFINKTPTCLMFIDNLRNAYQEQTNQSLNNLNKWQVLNLKINFWQIPDIRIPKANIFQHEFHYWP